MSKVTYAIIRIEPDPETNVEDILHEVEKLERKKALHTLIDIINTCEVNEDKSNAEMSVLYWP